MFTDFEHAFRLVGCSNALGELHRSQAFAGSALQISYKFFLEIEDIGGGLLAGFYPRLMISIDVNQFGLKSHDSLEQSD